MGNIVRVRAKLTKGLGKHVSGVSSHRSDTCYKYIRTQGLHHWGERRADVQTPCINATVSHSFTTMLVEDKNQKRLRFEAWGSHIMYRRRLLEVIEE